MRLSLGLNSNIRIATHVVPWIFNGLPNSKWFLLKNVTILILEKHDFPITCSHRVFIHDFMVFKYPKEEKSGHLIKVSGLSFPDWQSII